MLRMGWLQMRERGSSRNAACCALEPGAYAPPACQPIRAARWPPLRPLACDHAEARMGDLELGGVADVARDVLVGVQGLADDAAADAAGGADDGELHRTVSAAG